jgi:hypothetical protein
MSGKIHVAGPAPSNTPVKSGGLGNGLEASGSFTDRFGIAKHEHATRSQREVEQGRNFSLRLRPEIDQQVSARNQIEAGEWWVCQQVLDRKHNDRPQLRSDAIYLVISDEE